MNKPSSRTNKTLFLSLCAAATLLIAAPTNVSAQTINDDVVKLLRVSGALVAFDQMVDAMITQFRQMDPSIPASFWTGFKSKFSSDDLSRLMVPVYIKHFTHSDIKEMIKFYESPVGRKMARVAPAITAESMTIGQKWGEQIGEELIRELQKGGHMR